MLKVTILGCGSSTGVPRVAQGWGHCDPKEPKNRRRRCSILVERTGQAGTTRVLIDTSPDLREQLIYAEVQHLDAVLFTHEHADHTHGIDDLRPIFIHNRHRIPIHADDPTLSMLQSRFGYCFSTPPGSDYPPIVKIASKLRPGCPVTIQGVGGDIEFLPFQVHHGAIDALGFRFHNIAYTPDVKDIPAASLPALEGLEHWIIDALRPQPHPTHFSLQDALLWVEKMQPRAATLTNLHADLDYNALTARLPPHIHAAYDGLNYQWRL